MKYREGGRIKETIEKDREREGVTERKRGKYGKRDKENERRMERGRQGKGDKDNERKLERGRE